MNRAPYLALALAWIVLPRQQATRLKTVPRMMSRLRWANSRAEDLMAREQAWLDWNPREA